LEEEGPSQVVPSYSSGESLPGYSDARLMGRSHLPSDLTNDPGTLITPSFATACYLRDIHDPYVVSGNCEIGLLALERVRRVQVDGNFISHTGLQERENSTLVVQGNATIYGPVSLSDRCKLIVYGDALFDSDITLFNRCRLVVQGTATFKKHFTLLKQSSSFTLGMANFSNCEKLCVYSESKVYFPFDGSIFPVEREVQHDSKFEAISYRLHPEGLYISARLRFRNW
jgi:hypothetical protein